MSVSVIHPQGAVLDYLKDQYSDTRRKYHTWEHIQYMLDLYKQFVSSGLVVYDPAQVYAIWMHDVVYIPQNTDNENESSFMASEYLTSLGVDEATILEVQSIILDTIPPHYAWNDKSKLVIDLDLMMFIWPPQKYHDAVKQIREEYRHIKDRIWWASRRDILKKMMNRNPFFYSPFLSHHQSQAYRNIYTEIQHLDKQIAANPWIPGVTK